MIKCENIIDYLPLIKDCRKSTKKISYYNIACAFDIESTSFTRVTNGEVEKCSLMYIWCLGLNGFCFYGRTWDEFVNTINLISDTLELDKDNRLIIYIHNLAYEFQFFRYLFDWEKVFSIEVRKPAYCLTKNGVEFRCSYILSGYNLAKLGENLQRYPVQKMVGDLDYELIRHSETPLTEKEMKYCENDIRIVMAYIQEQIENCGDITKIPLTKTGFVRNYCRNACMYSGSHKKNTLKYLNYRKLMDSLTIEPEEYMQLKRAFQGGFTHASSWKSGKILHEVQSFDFTSSYPAVMVAEKFPMSKGELYNIKSVDDFEKQLNTYCCLFDIEVSEIESKYLIEHPISISRCFDSKGVINDNGRLVSAEKIRTTCTELDFKIIRFFYKWKNLKITNFRRYKKGYLPTDFVRAILKLYSDKTTLKDVEGKEVEYLSSKEMLNSTYGMCVTDICRDNAVYDKDDWSTEKPDITKAIDKYNKSKRRFLYYPWGVWVTAYARRNLFTGIVAFKDDYIYSDTDSIKALNAEKHMDYINKYNLEITNKLKRALDYHKISYDMIAPETIQGKKKPLGVWDDDGKYDTFKTLGAKRYIVDKGGKISITVSGVNKKIAVPYLVDTYGDDIFKVFDDDLYIPSDYTGKNTHTYIDYAQDGIITDYLGVSMEYHTLSGIHLEKADYHMSLSAQYADYIRGVQNYER